MTKNKGQKAESRGQDNYEATVLDFLNKEIAADPQLQERKEKSNELDAFVLDMLKQVINETDQNPAGQNAGPESVEDMLAEFPPRQEGSLPRENVDLTSNRAPKPDITAGLPLADEARRHEISNTTAIKPAAIKTPPNTSTLNHIKSVFASSAAKKMQSPIMAIAFIGLLVIVGVGVYSFVNSRSRAKDPKTSQTSTAGSITPSNESKVSNAPIQMDVTYKSPQANSPAPDHSPAIAASSKQTPVVPASTTKASGMTTGQPAPAGETLSAALPKAETPAAVIATPPVVANPSPVAEKQVPPASSEKPQLPVPAVDNKSAKNTLSVPVSTGSSAPETHIPAPAKITTSAIPISQASPKYPELAIRTRASATVVLDLEIDSQGKVIKATPVSGPPIFHPEAISAAMKWRYKPASIDGANVPSQSRISFNFDFKK